MVYMRKCIIFSKSNKRFGEIFSFKMKDTILKGGDKLLYSKTIYPLLRNDSDFIFLIQIKNVPLYRNAWSSLCYQNT